MELWEVPNSTPYIQLFKLFIEKKISAYELLKLFVKDKCFTFLTTGVNGIIFATCMFSVDRCRNCPYPIVLKMSKSLLYSNGGNVTVQEGIIHAALQKSIANAPKIYKKHLLRYVTHYVGPNNQVIVLSKFVKSPDKFKTLRDLLSSSTCTYEQLKVLLVQMFSLLHILRTANPGFVHMDLHSSQILLGFQTEEEFLPISPELGFYTPKTSFYAVLADFSSVYTNAMPQAHTFPVHIAQDIYRLFRDIEIHTRKSKILHAKILKKIDVLFQGKYQALQSITDPVYGFLINTDDIPFKSYVEVIPIL